MSSTHFERGMGPPKFCIDLEADWLIILDAVRGKSPGLGVLHYLIWFQDLYYKSCLLEFLVMINKLSLMILISKNKVCSHFYPAIRYKYPQNFQTSQISLYLTKIFNQKWNFSQSFLGGLKIFHQTYRITINYWKTVSMIFKIFESILNP